ncbi:MAG: PKD domain-containing protein [Bacteroidales bacterium]
MKKIYNLILIVFFFNSLELNAQLYLMNEDFSGASIINPPLNWINQTQTGTPTDKWHFDNPGNRITTNPFTSPFAIFDSENYSLSGGNEVVTLESPAVDASSNNNIYLFFDHYFKKQSSNQGVVEVFNGITWNTVFTIDSNVSVLRTECVDISVFAGGVSNTKVRFKWTGNGSGYWLVDNVKIYAPILRDAGITMITAPVMPLSAGLQSVKVNLKNFGYTPITNVQINWKVNNVLQIPFNWNNILTFNQTEYNIGIGTVNFASGGIYNIKIWTTNPNGSNDPNPLNDTTSVVLYTSLCGTYTLGGSNPDYPDFQSAANALNYSGITCPVVFKVRNGTYNEHIILNQIQGSSTVNTIQFQSETGNANLCKLYYQMNDPTNDYTLMLKGTDFITFKNLTISRLNGSSNIVIKNNSHHTSFDANILDAVSFDPTSNDNDYKFSNNILNGIVNIVKNDSNSFNFIFFKNTINKSHLLKYINNLLYDSNLVKLIPLTVSLSKNIIFKRNLFDISSSGYPGPAMSFVSNKNIVVDSNTVNVTNCGQVIAVNSYGCSNFRITSNTVIFNNAYAGIGITSSYSDSVIIKNNNIKSIGTYDYLIGINIIGNNINPYGIIIDGNNMLHLEKAILVEKTTSFLIKNNIINDIDTLFVNIDGGSGSIQGNTMNGIKFGNGIQLFANNIQLFQNKITNINEGCCLLNNGNNNTIYNNFFQAGGLGMAKGIIDNNTMNSAIFHNSINICSSDQLNGRSIEIISGNNNNIKNNIFSNKGNGYAMYIIGNPSALTLDYNDYYSFKKRLVNYQNIVYDSLPIWKNAVSFDQNSMAFNPYYQTDIFLNHNQSKIYNAATVISSVPNDIYNVTRTVPDIGATEYTPCLTDAGIHVFNGLKNPIQSGNTSISVELQNHGTTNLTSAKINWKVNGISQTVFSWNGNLAPALTTNVIIGSFNFTPVTTYNLQAWTSQPNISNDCNFRNDTARISDLGLQLCGIYTIGGSNPNFLNFTDAVTALNEAGISCPVVFKVRNGIYAEHILIKNIKGSSFVNTVTFESETANSNNVSLRYINYNPNNDYTIKLDSCKNIIFKNISILRDSGLYNVHIINQSANVRFYGNQLHNLYAYNLDSLFIVEKNIITKMFVVEHDEFGFSKDIRIYGNETKSMNLDYCSEVTIDSNKTTGNQLIYAVEIKNSVNVAMNKDSIFSAMSYTGLKLNKNQNLSFKNSYIDLVNIGTGIKSDSNNKVLISNNTIKYLQINNGGNAIVLFNSDSLDIIKNRLIGPGNILGCGINNTNVVLMQMNISQNYLINFDQGMNLWFLSSNNIVSNNEIFNSKAFGMQINGKLGVVQSNRIHNVSYGKGIENNAIKSFFLHNRVSGVFEGTAFLNNASEVNITNNYFQANGFSVAVGLQLSAADTGCSISFNNINITGIDPEEAVPLKLFTVQKLKLFNNIFANKGNGYSMICTSALTASQSDYNCFFTNGKYLIKKDAQSLIALNEWITITGLDAASKNINPFYVSDTNLKINQIQLNNTGFTMPGIEKDIDYTLRTLPPDIGAKEFTPCATDAGIDSLIGLSHNMQTNSFPITVLLQNQGTQTLSSVKIYYSINNVTQPVFYNWVGSLNSGATAVVNIGNYAFQPGVSSIDLKCWTLLPNGGADCDHYNDTAKYDKISLPLCGVYTIGGLNPNFQNFTEAANALYYSGISCPVIFKVRKAVYNERIKIGPVMGNNIVNSITFIAENGNPDSTVLSYLNNDPQNDFTLIIDSLININFLKLGILRQNGLKNIIVKNHTSFLTIDSCKVNDIEVAGNGLDSNLLVKRTNFTNKSLQLFGDILIQTKKISLLKNTNVFNFLLNNSKDILIDSCQLFMTNPPDIRGNIRLENCNNDTIQNNYTWSGNYAFSAVNAINSNNILIKNNVFNSTVLHDPVNVSDGDNINIENNTLLSNANNGISVLQNSKKIRIKKNSIKNIATSVANYGIYLDNTCKTIKVDSNTSLNYFCGISSTLSFLSDSILRNHIICNNIGILVAGDSGVVRQNRVDSSYQITGIDVSGFNLKIIQNKILSLQQSRGIFAKDSSHLIANNFVQIGGLGVAKGIEVSPLSVELKIIHNSINITSSDLINGKGIEFNGGKNHIVKNNIFCNYGNGYASYLSVLPQLGSWDYNVYYSPLKKIGWYNSVVYDTLSVWANLISGDANSMFINPYYVSTTNLQPQQRFINGAGVPYQDVLVDINDILRNLIAPDIGAVEFKVDFGITDLLNPSLACTHGANDSVIILLKQFGDVPFTDIPLAYQVNNGVIVYDTINGSISNNLIHVFPVTVNLTAAGTYVFKIWLTANNDDNPNNDTLVVTRYSNIPPQINVFSTSNTCENLSIPFNVQASIMPPFTISSYEWIFGNGDSAFVKNPVYRYDSTGTYHVVLKVYSSAGCYKDTTATISVFATPKASYFSSPHCFGIPVSFSNQTTISSTDTVFYKWSFGDNTFEISKNPTHLYPGLNSYSSSLIASTLNGCKDTAIMNVIIHSTPVLVLTSQNSVCGLPNGFIHSQVNSGSTPYSYLWSNGSTTSDLDNILQGNFILTVTDTNGCYDIDSALIVSPTLPLQIQFNSRVYVCDTFNNGWIKANISGGTQPYAILWNNGSTMDSIYNLGPGNYVISIADAGNCQISDSTFLLNTPNPVLDIIATNVACFGESTGSATANPLIGIPPYNYSWTTNPVQSGQTATNLGCGNYSVIVVDYAGCIDSDTVFVNQPDSFQITTTVINPSCNNGTNGSLGVTVAGATPPYSYQWNTNPAQATNIIQDLGEGSYAVTITDNNNCIKTLPAFTLLALTQIHASFITIPELGFSPLTVNFNFTGSGANSFAWDFGDGNTSILQNPSNIYSSSDTYFILLTVNSGSPDFCEDTASFKLFVDKPSDIIIPNFFSPNGDEINDYFYARSVNIKIFEMIIYNRWGTEIFKTNSLIDKWDGTVNGSPSAEGTYFYLIKAKGTDDKDFQLHGSVTLLR